MLMKSMDVYDRSFINDEGKQVVHSWKDPYPKMYYMSTEIEVDQDENEKSLENERKTEKIKNQGKPNMLHAER
jgi:hypothetical protein